MTDTFLDDAPAWVTMCQQLKRCADQHGESSETGWLLKLAADEIAKNADRIDFLERAVMAADARSIEADIKAGLVKPTDL